jgi:hypothetical protein
MALIHRACLPEEGWTVPDLKRFARDYPNRAAKVIVGSASDGSRPQVLGTLLYMTDAETCRVRRVCIRPDTQRYGLGRHALAALTGASSPVRRSLFTARVDVRRWQAAALFRDADFAAAAELVRYGRDRGLEGWWFTLARAEAPRRVLAGAG